MSLAATTTSAAAVQWALGRSILVAGGGYRVLKLLSRSGLQALAEEAFVQHRQAETVRVTDAGSGDGATGNPNRWLESAPGGRMLNAFYRAERVRRILQAVTGVRWRQSGGGGSYSYYRGADHHLGLHRDIDECDLAVITCVYDQREQTAASGELVLYPSRQGESLARIEKSPELGAVPVHLRPCESLILLGGLVPHRVAPLAEGHVRIVAPLCYRAMGVPAGRRTRSTVPYPDANRQP